jgi:Flp pilus assembly pilin Flp
MQPCAAIRRADRGSAAIEFGLIAPALIALLMGIAQVSVVYFAKSGLSHAVAEGARLATVFPRPSDDVIVKRISAHRFGLDPKNLKAAKITHGSENGADFALIELSYTMRLDFVFIPMRPVTLRESRRVFIYELS